MSRRLFRAAAVVLLSLSLASCHHAADFRLAEGGHLQLIYNDTTGVVCAAVEMFCQDYRQVFGGEVSAVADGCLETTANPENAGKKSHRRKDSCPALIRVYTVSHSDGRADLAYLDQRREAFVLTVHDGVLDVYGSDAHGTAYGLLEVSRLIGVSPWEWWADVHPTPLRKFRLKDGYRNVQSPSVEFRGIFINDEDWGMCPWSYQTYEPSDVKGQIGPQTHARLFELLLRLRANTFWPAMHACSVPFYLTEGNRQTAEHYGIYIGTSHCEPMLCNVNGEWKRRGQGDYDYVHNAQAVKDFWEARVVETAGTPAIYTLGMRGVHDGAMQGAKGLEQQRDVLANVISDQREMLREHVNADPTAVPQVFIPYKEVLDVWNAGLQVPDDVTLVWCDDNYGYIRHFPTREEAARPGGNGVYYHVSYWGRPHDYLWLGTFQPALLYQQMNLAYERGIRRLWILNVGDLKPAEYQTELFLDMAWDIQGCWREGPSQHLKHFLAREFGRKAARKLQPVLQKYYRLSYKCKPEFLGNTRTEEKDPAWKLPKDMPWSRQEVEDRMAQFRHMSDKVAKVARKCIPDNRLDAYYQLVQYPVQASAQMNFKMLGAQLARHGLAPWENCDAAYDSIRALTYRYNEGKWKGMMSYGPRSLREYTKLPHDTLDTPLPETRQELFHLNASAYKHGKARLCEGLGYCGQAVYVSAGDEVMYKFKLKRRRTDRVEMEVRLVPTHPVEGDQLRFSVSMDGSPSQTFAYETKGRSEEWKQNVYFNQAIRRVELPVIHRKKHHLVIKALDEGVVLDQLTFYPL